MYIHCIQYFKHRLKIIQVLNVFSTYSTFNILLSKLFIFPFLKLMLMLFCFKKNQIRTKNNKNIWTKGHIQSIWSPHFHALPMGGVWIHPPPGW